MDVDEEGERESSVILGFGWRNQVNGVNLYWEAKEQRKGKRGQVNGNQDQF